MAIFLAAPLAFFLAWKDKKGEQQRESLEALDGWAEVIALVGLDDDEDVLTWRQRCHNLVDVVFDKAEATAAAVVAATKAVKAKVSEMIENHKAAVIAAAEAAETARLEAVKAEAKTLGFVSREDVAEMIADAISQHEAKKHFKINPAFQGKLRPSDEELAKILDAFGAEDFSMHAEQVVLKSIEEMSKEELREELGCGKKYNLRTLRARVRAARAANS